MKKHLSVTGLLLLGVLMFSSCGSSSSGDKQPEAKETARVQYTCPMHADVISDSPGDCPKCGMALVKKE